MSTSEVAQEVDKRIARGHERRVRILSAASREFGEKGYDGARIADIARRAGVTDAGVLHHFSTKHDLFMAVVERREEAYQVVQLPVASVRELFDQFIAAVRLAAEDPDLLRFRVMLTGASHIAGHPVEGHTTTNLKRALQAFVPVIEAGIDSGELVAGTDPRQVVLELLALNEGIRDQWSALPDEIDYVATFTAAADALYERVATRS